MSSLELFPQRVTVDVEDLFAYFLPFRTRRGGGGTQHARCDEQERSAERGVWTGRLRSSSRLKQKKRLLQTGVMAAASSVASSTAASCIGTAISAGREADQQASTQLAGVAEGKTGAGGVEGAEPAASALLEGINRLKAEQRAFFFKKKSRRSGLRRSCGTRRRKGSC